VRPLGTVTMVATAALLAGPASCGEDVLPGATERLARLGAEPGLLRQSIESALQVHAGRVKEAWVEAAAQTTTQNYPARRNWRLYAVFGILAVMGAIIAWLF
jgi:hypothetical protein